MMNRSFRSVMVAAAIVAMTTPAWAQVARTVKESLAVFLPGVDCRGCLTDCGGVCSTFCACVNTCTGKFTGSAKGCVQNESCRAQCYKNYNFFKDPCVSVKCSVYSVTKKGAACYTATGCLSNSQPEA